jgi:hypothetical protein
MFDHNTRRVLISFHIVFLTFDPCFRQVTSEISKGATVMIVPAIVLFTIIKRVLFLLAIFLTLFQVTGDNLEEAIFLNPEDLIWILIVRSRRLQI